MTTPKKNNRPFQFEQTLEQLTVLVNKMEHGDLTLEDALAQFETGIQLIQAGQKALASAQQKVQILTQKNNEPLLVDFDEQKN